jgi:hypothetical protein
VVHLRISPQKNLEDPKKTQKNLDPQKKAPKKPKKH